MKKTNWEKIKTEYITTDISTRKLAEKYKVSANVMAARCSKDKWVDERKKHNEKVVRKAVQKTESPKAKALAQNLARVNRMNAIVDQFLDGELYNKHLVQVGLGKGIYDTEERVFKKPDTRSIRDMATTIEKMANVSLVLTDFMNEKDRMMTEMAQQRIEIEKQRLELEKMRLELDKQKGTESKDITITLSDDLKEWAE